MEVLEISDEVRLEQIARLEEEDLATARLTITTDKNGDIRAMQKGGSGSFSPGEIDAAIEIAQTRGKEIRQQFLQ